MERKDISFRKLYNHDVRKVNAVVTAAAFNFTSIEQDLFDYISTLTDQPYTNEKGEIKYNTTFKINYLHFCIATNTKPDSRTYENIDNSIKNLNKKTMELILPNNGITGVKVIERYEIHQGKPYYAYIQLDDRMIPVLISKKNNFLEHHPEYVLFIKNNKYAKRIYGWLAAQLNKDIGKKLKYTKFDENRTLKDIKIEDFKETKEMNEEEKENLKKSKLRFLNMISSIKKDSYTYNLDFEQFKYNLSISSNYRGYKTIESKILKDVKKIINESTDITIENMFYNDEYDSITFIVRKKGDLERIAVDEKLKKQHNDKFSKVNIKDVEPSQVITDYKPGATENIDKLITQWIDIN